jgi:V8-like Glu-specific endopeptidase
MTETQMADSGAVVVPHEFDKELLTEQAFRLARTPNVIPRPIPRGGRMPLTEAADKLRSHRLLIERRQAETRSQASVLPESATLMEQPGTVAGKPTTTRVTDTAVFPCCAVGKLFATYGEITYAASAWTVGEAAIFTAAHCLWDRDLGWPDSLLFQPRHSDGNPGSGSWTPISAAVPRGWIDSRGQDYGYDLAIMIASEPIAPITGQLGWVANGSEEAAEFVGLGYPSDSVINPEHDGRWMWQSAGEAIDHAEFLGAYNDMSAGCSGGPWVVCRDGAVFAKGLNSFRFDGESDRMHSPHLGEAFVNLIEWAEQQAKPSKSEDKG